MAEARLGVRRRREREYGRALCQSAARGEPRRERALSRPCMGTGRGPGGFRGGGLLCDGGSQAPELFRLGVPLFQRGPGPGLSRRERRVRLPGLEGHLLLYRRRAQADSLRQRRRRRAQDGRQGADDRAVRALRRALRLRLCVLQPRLGAREGLRREQGRGRTALAVRPRAPGHEHGRLQQEPPRQVHGAFQKRPLDQRRAGGPAVRRGPPRPLQTAR